LKNDSSRPIRWWPAAVVLLLVLLALAWVWGISDEHRQGKVADTIRVALYGGALLLLWVLLGSRLRWRARVVVLLVVGAVAAATLALVQVRGFTGDRVPILAWRWERPADESLADSRGVEPDPARAISGPDDYPGFLGPRRDATLTGVDLATDWEAQPPVEVWRRSIGAGWSAFAVAGDYAVTQEQRGPEEQVAAYDVDTGEPLWTHADPVRYEDAQAGIGPRATPTIHEGRVYSLGATGILSALDLRTGERLWSRDTAADAGAERPSWGVAASPLILDDLVIVPPGGPDGRSLVAYDRASGEIAWSGGSDPPAYASPVAVELAGRRQILVFNGAGLASHDARDGRVLWSEPWPRGTENVSQPVPLPGDRVFLSSGYDIGGRLWAIAAHGGGLRATTVWESRGLKAKFTNVVARDGYLYGLDDGILVCLDATEGKRRWKRGRYGHGQVLLVDDLLLVQAESGEVALVAADAQAYRELGRFPALGGKTWNHAALAGRRLFVRNDREAARYDLPVREDS
jgi:outer membrane protein assembly factor BamB